MILVTGSAGLIGSEAVRFLVARDIEVIGIDNDRRSFFFGPEASTAPARQQLELLPLYSHLDLDIRDRDAIDLVLQQFGDRLQAVVHAAAQPSHDWAARDPVADFDINAVGTLNLLESTRCHTPNAAFVFISTNKVYGDTPNHLPFVEKATRWDLDESHPFAQHGIDESMSIDSSLHSLFGVSKTSADLLVQEYGRYFGMNTVSFRCGCVTGPQHSGARLHGFLAYLVDCAVKDVEYEIIGYQGKQVRDNIHAADLVEAIWLYLQNPRQGEVYNIGGGRYANCSVVEAIELCEARTGRPLRHRYNDKNRIGDHMWWISSSEKFRLHYRDWRPTHTIDQTLDEIFAAAEKRAFERSSTLISI